MKVILPQFNNSVVLVIGDVMLDRYLYGSTSRISPEAPVPVVKVGTIKNSPGGAANVAMNIASLGASSLLIGVIGADDAGDILRQTLKKVKVKYNFVVMKNYSTITKLRVLSHNQQLIRIDFGENFGQIDQKQLYSYILDSFKQVKVLIISDYAKGTLKNLQNIIQLARQSGILVLIDPKGNCFENYRGATLLTPNLSEFEAVVGRCSTEDEIVSRGMQLIIDYDLYALLITRSEKGMSLLQPNKPPLHLPTQAQEVYDVTGAGDTVIGVLATVLAAGKSLEEACFLANIAAGIVVGKLGASTVSLLELENAVHTNSNNTFGIVDELELKNAIKMARYRGEKLVMTNGVFDILHAGHVSYLAEARKLGDRLIVAVNSDESTKRLKGKTRPINSLEKRMIMLSALKSVDWVVAFEEESPQRLIAELLPDFLVKGGDYKPEDIIGSTEIWSNGGDVRVIDFKKNYSTSDIIQRIYNHYNNICKNNNFT